MHLFAFILPAVLLAAVLQSTQPELPVTVRCELNTELTLEKISVSVKEKREVKLTPGTDTRASATVTLTDLPEGDLHLLFYYEDSLCGTVELTSANRGELIRVKVRLVKDNAILLDEYRIRGISGFSTPRTDLPRSGTDSASPDAPTPRPPSPHRAQAASHDPCPAPGEPITVSGKVTRLIDDDSFELQSGASSYVVYIGSSTRFRGSRKDFQPGELREQQALVVTGTVAAGPEGECSIGAKDIRPQS